MGKFLDLIRVNLDTLVLDDIDNRIENCERIENAVNQIHSEISWSLAVEDLGSITGDTTIDAKNAHTQHGIITGDCDIESIDNLDGHPVLIYLDNSGEHTVGFSVADFIQGETPDGKFTVFIQKIGVDVFAVIGGAYEGVE